MDVFWNNHCPEFRAPSKQYASIVFYHNEQQYSLALETLEKNKVKIGKQLHTSILPYKAFYMAENYHQKYYLQLTREFMNELQTVYPAFDDIIESTAAARINGYIKGYGSSNELQRELNMLGLSERAQKRLKDIVGSYE